MAARSLDRYLGDFRRHPWLHIVSVAVLTVSLLILGGFFLCYRNFERLAEQTNPSLGATLYLAETLSDLDATAFVAKLEPIAGVQRAVFKTQASVAQEMRDFVGGDGASALGLVDFFPRIVELELRPGISASQLKQIKEAIGRMSEVESYDFSDEWVAHYRRIRRFLRLFGVCLMASVLLGTSFIIANFMGMRHQARREQIEIVRLIGASERFVLTPFLWEGVLEGVLGGTLALGLLYGLKSALSTFLSVQWSSLLGVREWFFLSLSQVALVVVVGIAMATLGSVTVFLRFQEKSAR